MLFECLETRHLLSTTSQDHLFIGDQGDPDNPADDSVVQFDATNGRLIGSFVSTGQLIGPRGMVPNGEDLLVVNQNVDQPVNGEVRRFDGSSGAALSGLVLQDHPQAPFAPRGMVVKDNVVFVADALGSSIWGPSFPPISKYDATSGAFLGHLIPNACFTSELHPRGLVFGSDGRLYASYFNPAEFESSDPPGYILRFLDTTSGAFETVAANHGGNSPLSGNLSQLRNPEGIAFGPDHRLYVTTFRAHAPDNGILVLDVANKRKADFLSLGGHFAQALLFGPADKLYVPLTGGGSEAGSVRVYDPADGSFEVLIAPSLDLQQPWYLTFGKTNPATLAYEP